MVKSKEVKEILTGGCVIIIIFEADSSTKAADEEKTSKSESVAGI